MIVNSTEVKAYLNLSIYSTAYDTYIDRYIPIVQDNIQSIVNHRFHDPYNNFNDDQVIFSSTAKTITLGSDSTASFLEKFKVGDTIDILNSFFNDGYYTVSSITSSYVLVVNESSILDESSSNYDRKVYLYRCNFPKAIKAIASKMVWWHIDNSTNINPVIQSESYGNYSVTYVKNASINNAFGYPDHLLTGLKRKINAW